MWTTDPDAGAVGYGGRCAEIADCDSDGMRDLAVSAYDEFLGCGQFVDVLSSATGRKLVTMFPQHGAKAFGSALIPTMRTGVAGLVVASGRSLQSCELPNGVALQGTLTCTELAGYPRWTDWRTSVVSIGDDNQDGQEEYVVGTGDTEEAGSRGSIILMASSSSIPRWRLSGEKDDDRIGLGVEVIPDLDGDGVSDVAVQGRQMCVFVSSSLGYRLATLRGDYSFAHEVQSCGDVTGDDIADICIGEPARQGNGSTGIIHVVDGATLEMKRDLVSPPGYVGFGTRIVDLGDVDRDYLSDLAVLCYTSDGFICAVVISGGTGNILGSEAFGRESDCLVDACAMEDSDGDSIPEIAVGVLRGDLPKRTGYVAKVSMGKVIQRW